MSSTPKMREYLHVLCAMELPEILMSFSTARKIKARKEIDRQQVSKTNEQLILAEGEERIAEITNLEEAINGDEDFCVYDTPTKAFINDALPFTCGTQSFHVIVFTKTWQSEVNSSEDFCPEYQVFRRKKCVKSGKGVMVAARSTITAKLFSLYSRDNVEYLGVRVKTANPDLFVDCSYIPQ
uniref:Uncharacterized protein n=1 Tax=Glossina austeni TaxID=7395 RepID=A0A1A9V5Q3_GLOAU